MDSLDEQITHQEIQLIKLKRWTATGKKQRLPVHAIGSPSEFLKEIEDLAKKSPLRILDLKPLSGEETGAKSGFALDMQTDSSLPALTRFLFEMQSSPSNLIVSRIQINANGSDLKTGMTILSKN